MIVSRVLLSTLFAAVTATGKSAQRLRALSDEDEMPMSMLMSEETGEEVANWLPDGHHYLDDFLSHVCGPHCKPPTPKYTCNTTITILEDNDAILQGGPNQGSPVFDTVNGLNIKYGENQFVENKRDLLVHFDIASAIGGATQIVGASLRLLTLAGQSGEPCSGPLEGIQQPRLFTVSKPTDQSAYWVGEDTTMFDFDSNILLDGAPTSVFEVVDDDLTRILYCSPTGSQDNPSGMATFKYVDVTKLVGQDDQVTLKVDQRECCPGCYDSSRTTGERWNSYRCGITFASYKGSSGNPNKVPALEVEYEVESGNCCLTQDC